jgi:hypothetical protein
MLINVLVDGPCCRASVHDLDVLESVSTLSRMQLVMSFFLAARAGSGHVGNFHTNCLTGKCQSFEYRWTILYQTK